MVGVATGFPAGPLTMSSGGRPLDQPRHVDLGLVDVGDSDRSHGLLV
jgi:hypothetical protein